MGRNARRKNERHRRGGKDLEGGHASRNWIIGVIGSLLVIVLIAAWQWKSNLWAYKTAPSFTLQASTGQLVSLRDYLGKQEVVIIFYMGAG